MKFEWDENKRKANIVKHGLDFVYAEYVLTDENAIEFIDNRKNYGEVRKRTIGKYGKQILVAVVHTDRNGFVRVISMRYASQKERRLYYAANQNDF